MSDRPELKDKSDLELVASTIQLLEHTGQRVSDREVAEAVRRLKELEKRLSARRPASVPIASGEASATTMGWYPLTAEDRESE